MTIEAQAEKLAAVGRGELLRVLGVGFGIGFVLEREGEPIVGIALGHHADFVAEFAGVEIEDELAGDGLEVGAFVIDDDVAAVGEDAKFGERLFDFGEFLIQSCEREAEAVGGDAALDELLGGAEADEVAEIVEIIAGCFARRDDAQLFPIGELFVGDVEQAQEFAPGEAVCGGCAHRSGSSHF